MGDVARDDLDDLIDERTRRNPAFPALVDAALERRRAQEAALRAADTATRRLHGGRP